MHTYRTLPLRALLERIACHSDREALSEFHDHRTVFSLDGDVAMLFVSFVGRLRETLWARRLTAHEALLLDGAYDLTVDKFSRLPGVGAKDRGASGLDCRHYFQSFLSEAARRTPRGSEQNPLVEEVITAQVLKHFVIGHFRLSCMAARRDLNPARSRYAWKLPGGVLYVWLPVTLTGKQRGRWLRQHIEDPDPTRSGERERVQAVIDAELGRAYHGALVEEEISNGEKTPLTALIEKEVSEEGLPRVIAAEKAANIDAQRPAIRALGRARLKKLIQRIFEDLQAGTYQEKAITEEFSLSRATLSRFAGSRWELQSGRRPPDLWRNVAETVAYHEPFVETAKEAGVWAQVRLTLERD